MIKRKYKGFTLTEVLLVVSIFTIIMIGIISFYIGQYNLNNNHINLSNAQIKHAAVHNNLVSILSHGRALLASTTISGNNYTISNSIVIVELPSVDNTGNIISNSFDTVVIILEGTQLKSFIEAADGSRLSDGEKLLLDDLTSFAVSYENESNPAQSDWFELNTSQDVDIYSGTRSVGQSSRITLKNK